MKSCGRAVLWATYLLGFGFALFRFLAGVPGFFSIGSKDTAVTIIGGIVIWIAPLALMVFSIFSPRAAALGFLCYLAVYLATIAGMSSLHDVMHASPTQWAEFSLIDVGCPLFIAGFLLCRRRVAHTNREA